MKVKPRGYGRTCRRGHRVIGDNVRIENGYARCRSCRDLNKRVPVAPEDGVQCLICGEVLRRLPNHLKSHGLNTKIYKERFPGAPLVGSMMQGIGQDLIKDRMDAGTWKYPRPPGACIKGHKLTARNTYPGGRCKQCQKETDRKYHLANKKKRNAYNRDYYQRNKEKWVQYLSGRNK